MEPNTVPARQTALSIVNASHADPMGSAYLPPTPNRPWWRDPDGNRVTVSQVWTGADNETKLWIFEATWACIADATRSRFEDDTRNGRIFRGAGVEHLHAELRSQLGPNHWINS